jgi:hypothetical protein
MLNSTPEKEIDNRSDFDKSLDVNNVLIKTVSLKDLAPLFMTQDNKYIKDYVSTQAIANTSN